MELRRTSIQFARPTEDEFMAIIKEWAKENGGAGAIAIAIMRLNSPIFKHEIDSITMHDMLRAMSVTVVLAPDELDDGRAIN